jgi:RND family efflux transporter MFP subunit
VNASGREAALRAANLQIKLCGEFNKSDMANLDARINIGVFAGLLFVHMPIQKTVIMKTRIKATQRLTWSTIAIISLFIGLAIAGCGGSEKETGGKAGPPGGRGGRGGPVPIVAVQTTTVQRISIQREVELAGSLASPNQAKVSSEVAGVVQQLFVELGQEVKQGQIIAKLDPQELNLALQRAKSQLKQTEAQLGINGIGIKEPPPDEQISSVRLAIANRDDAQAQLRRAQKLRNQNLLSQADLDTAETKVKVTEANYQAAIENVQSLKATLQDRRQAVELAEKKLNDTSIRSSVAGQASERLVQKGEYIRENTAIVSIVQMNPLKVKTAIQERYSSVVAPGLAVEFSVESFPGEKFKGSIAYVSPAVDQNLRTFPVEVLVDNSHRKLKPGFFVKGVIFTRRDENIMAVPEDAISSLAGVSNVFVIEEVFEKDKKIKKVRQQMISLGTRVGNVYEVLSGLKGDELLASTNLSLLASNVQVTTSGMRGNTDPEKSKGRMSNGGRP